MIISNSLISASVTTYLQQRYKYKIIKYAIEENLAKVQKLLQSDGIDINYIDDLGATALIHASSAGHENIVAELIKFGANLDIENNNDCTALGIACLNGNLDIAKLLLKYGAKISPTLLTNETLTSALEEEEVRLMRQFVDHHKDLSRDDMYKIISSYPSEKYLDCTSQDLNNVNNKKSLLQEYNILEQDESIIIEALNLLNFGFTDNQNSYALINKTSTNISGQLESEAV
jgi:ankyrin repeat protein